MGRVEIVAFLRRKWAKESESGLIKALWAFNSDRIAVRLRTNDTTILKIGLDPVATRIGNSTRTALCGWVLQASMTADYGGGALSLAPGPASGQPSGPN